MDVALPFLPPTPSIPSSPPRSWSLKRDTLDEMATWMDTEAIS